MLASLKTAEDISKALQKAIEYRRNGDLDNAILVYQELIKLQPDNPVFYDRKAQTQAQKGCFSEAIDNYRQAISLGIENPIWTYKNLGDALREENKLEEAELTYSEAIKVNSGNPFVYDCLGQVQAQQEKFSEAIDNYRQAISLGIENSTWTYKNLENALKAENRIEEAESVHEEFLKVQSKKSIISNSSQLQPEKSPDTNTDVDNRWLKLHDQGDNCFKQQKWEDAIASYQQSIELNPNYFWSYYNLGRALSELKHWEEAIFAFEQATERNPNFAKAYSCLGKACHQLNKSDEAISAFKRAIELDKNQPSWVQENLAEALARANHPQLADYVEDSSNSLSSEELLELAQKAEAEGKLIDAVSFYQKLIVVEPDSLETHIKLGKLFVQLKYYEEAISIYEKALAIKSDDKLYHLLATPLEKLQRWEEIVDVYNNAIKLKPDYYFYHHRLGNFYHKIGKSKEAIASYLHAIDLNPNYAWVHYHLGETYRAEDSLQEAINCYQTAIKIQPDLSRVSEALAEVIAKQQQLEAKSSSRKRVKITASEEPRVQANSAIKTGISIVMYPRFKNKHDFSDHFYRMLWYLNPIVEQIGKITIPVAFEDVNPDACPSYLDEKAADFYDRFSEKISFNFNEEVDDFVKDIKSASFLLRWNMEEDKSSTSKDPGLDLIRTKKVWRIDHHKEQFAGSFYLKCVVENDLEYEKNLAESQEKLHDLAESLKSETGFIFGTGPSLSQAYNFRFDSGETIACNSMLKNKTLMEYLSPRLIVAADPIFHAGCSSYAADFRGYLCDALEYFQSHLVVPMRDIHIYKHNLPKELRDRVIGVPLKKAEVPNLNLLEEFHVTSTGNVLTLYLLPLAATLFNRIGIMGCDGRPLQENNYFWKHDPSSQIVNKMSVIQEAHGAFFAIDYDDYYLTHCDTLQKWLNAADSIGKESRNLTPSYIPALQERTSSLQDNSLPDWINVNGVQASGEPLVSIIMPARNAAETIAKSIKSIQDEELKEWEIIVINDGSMDDTVSVVEEIRQQDPRVGLYHTGGRGVSFARNVALSVVRGKYVGFLDADDLFENQALTKRIKALEDNPDWSGVYCRTEIVDDDLNQLGWSVGDYKRKINFSDMHGNIHLASVVAKADVLRSQSFRVGLANGEDWLYLAQVLRAGNDLEYVPDCNVAYRIHERSTVLQDFVGHENKLIEIIDVLYDEDSECTAPADKYKFGLSQIKSPDKQLVVLKRRISLLSFLLLSRKARQFYECIQEASNLPWDSLDEKAIIGSVRSTSMRYYACTQEQWQEKLQENSSYIKQVFSDFKIDKIAPKFHEAILQICL